MIMSATESPIRVGLMSPFSGLVELYGPEISWAGQIAANEINEAGGLLGRPFELIIVDDGSLPDTAVPAANRLIDEEGCVAIIGNLLSNSRISVASMVAEPRRIPYLNFSFYEGSIWTRYFFHFAALPNQQIEKMIPYMADKFGLKMFFAGSNYEWPRGSIDAAKRSLSAHGGEVVGEAYFDFGTGNFDGLLDELSKSGADVFVPYFAGSDQTNLLTQFTNKGLKKHMAVVMGHYDEAMVGHLPAEVREGFYSSNTYFMSVDTPENKSYKERLGELPDVTGVWPNGNGVLTNFGEGTYVCVKAFAQAVEMAGTTEAEAVIDALENITVKGPQGTVAMDPATHHAKVNTHLSRCNADGTFEIIQTFEAEPPEIPARYRDQFPGLRQEVEESRKEARDSFLDIVAAKNTSAGFIHTDENGLIVEVNDHASEIFDYSKDEFIGMSIHLLLPPHMREQHKEYFKRFVDSSQTNIAMGKQGDIFGYRKDGSQFPAQAAITKSSREGEARLIATIFDITDIKENVDDLQWQTSHDPLTGLLNRAAMVERLGRALDRSGKSDTTIEIILLDIKGFGDINDRYGFEVGDDVLVFVANALIHTAAKGTTIGRIGGDEFLIICEQKSDECKKRVLSEHLSASLKHGPLADGMHVALEVDFRNISVTGSDKDADQLLTSLYEAA